MKKKSTWKKAVAYLKKKGVKFNEGGGWAEVTPLLEWDACINLTKASDYEIPVKQRGKIAWNILVRDGKVSGEFAKKIATSRHLAANTSAARTITRHNRWAKKQKKEKPADTKKFYTSYEWRKLRMVVLKRDGRQCACCGATPANGAVMHVDHIKPLRLNWEKRLDESNLQVLCGVCNHGKGNWDETDWNAENQTIERSGDPDLSVIMGEKMA